MLGNFSGVYRVDPATRRHARTDLARNVSLALLAILATALALYPVIISLNRDVLQLSAGLMRSNIELMEVLGSAIAKRDSDRDLHNYRVCLYSIRFAEALGLPEKEIRTIIAGAFLRDVGKIGISDAILLKPGKLTAKEFSTMKTHVELGTDIVAKSTWLDSAREVIEFHHERFDGSGYLRGLTGESIPLVARIFAIVDVFDALNSRRPYKEPFPPEVAMRILAEGSMIGRVGGMTVWPDPERGLDYAGQRYRTCGAQCLQGTNFDCHEPYHAASRRGAAAISIYVIER